MRAPFELGLSTEDLSHRVRVGREFITRKLMTVLVIESLTFHVILKLWHAAVFSSLCSNEIPVKTKMNLRYV